MIRTLMNVAGIGCVIVLVLEGGLLTYLWYQGNLNSNSIKDIQAVLSGDQYYQTEDDNREREITPSVNDVLRERSMRILEMNTRENELVMFKNMINERANQLIKQQEMFERNRQAFEDRLKQIEENVASEATEQIRAILLAMQPDDALKFLVPLSIEENVTIMKGMPEKNVARIMKEFLNADQNQIQRAHEIIDALNQGEPARQLIEKTAENLDKDDNAAKAIQ